MNDPSNQPSTSAAATAATVPAPLSTTTTVANDAVDCDAAETLSALSPVITTLSSEEPVTADADADVHTDSQATSDDDSDDDDDDDAQWQTGTLSKRASPSAIAAVRKRLQFTDDAVAAAASIAHVSAAATAAAAKAAKAAAVRRARRSSSKSSSTSSFASSSSLPNFSTPLGRLLGGDDISCPAPYSCFGTSTEFLLYNYHPSSRSYSYGVDKIQSLYNDTHGLKILQNIPALKLVEDRYFLLALQQAECFHQKHK